jgi:hypothetical protein
MIERGAEIIDNIPRHRKQQFGDLLRQTNLTTEVPKFVRVRFGKDFVRTILFQDCRSFSFEFGEVFLTPTLSAVNSG